MEIENEKGEIKITFTITEVSNKFLRHVQETIKAVKHIYHSVINYEESNIPPLETESLPFAINDPTNKENSLPTKEQTLKWLYNKAFEDFIIGLTETLIEAYEKLKLLSLSKRTKERRDLSEEQIITEFSSITNKAKQLHFPELLNEIESELGVSLPYKKEILSVNKVRTCLVHRNGLISEKDINDTTNRLLKLQYIRSITMVLMGDKLVEATWEIRKGGIQAYHISYNQKEMEIEFKEGEYILLDHNHFNDVAYTCAIFSLSLLKLFDEKLIKEGFKTEPIPPFEATLGA